MPELPEVETVRRGLDVAVVGRRIERVEVGRLRTVRRTSAEAVIDGLSGTMLTSAGRRGKYLVCQLDSGESLMVHLRMSGQLLLAPPERPRPAHSHVVALLAPGRGRPAEELRFVDPRTFGEVVVFDPAQADAVVPELRRLGLDPLVDEMSRAQVRNLLRSRQRQMKALLVDQTVIAGIGNIYADEILHAARVSPFRRSDTLSAPQIVRLHGAIGDVLGAAVDAGGSTLRDAQYVDLMGSTGSFQLFHRVVDRGGQRCLTCQRGVIRRAMVGGRSTSWCPWCQR